MNGIQGAQTCGGARSANPIIGTDPEKCLSGIYQIANNVNGKIYIGSAVNLKQRFRIHLCRLKKDNHHSIYLQRAWNIDGATNFVFIVLEYVPDKKQLLTRENYYFQTMQPQYNMTPIAGSSLGLKRSAETRRKISDAEKGKQKWLGKKHRTESRKKMSQAKKGKKLGEENHNSKLTELQVIEIKKRLATEYRTQSQIARDYGVTPTLITNIKKGKTWKHIKDATWNIAS